MATGLIKNTTRIAVTEEVTEGTYVAPTTADQYIQPLEDGFEISPAKELVERSILRNSIGQATPRTGIKSATASLPVEFRASGTEGDPTDFDLLIESALGNRRQITSRVTTDTGHTTTQINLDASSVLNFAVGDIIVILESGAHSAHAVTAVDTGVGTESITILPAADSAPSDNVEIAETTVYYPADSGHKPLSLSVYWANEIRESVIGAKVTSMSLENFTTGQIASLNFAMEALSFDEQDGAAPNTPSFDSGLPPLILSACIYQDGTSLELNNFAFSLENTLGFITDTCSENGRRSSRVTARSISGSFDPYKDDTSVDQFSKFNLNTPYSIFGYAYNPSSTTGEFDLGSVVGFYLPNCITTSKVVGDNEGVLIENIEFSATAGDAGDSDDIYLGFI